MSDMSDGPYRSLPMPRCWKRLAEFSENANFGSADMRAAAIDALGRTCRKALPADVANGLRNVFLERQPGLFVDRRIESVEALRPLVAGDTIGRLLLDHAICVLHEGGRGEDGLTAAARRMLEAVGARAIGQIEEHYLRDSAPSMARQAVMRIEQALDTADTTALARRLCGLESEGSRRASLKHKGIDDGVPLQ